MTEEELNCQLALINGYLVPFAMGFSYLIRPEQANFKMVRIPAGDHDMVEGIKHTVIQRSFYYVSDYYANNSYPDDWTRNYFQKRQLKITDTGKWQPLVQKYFREGVSNYIWNEMGELDDYGMKPDSPREDADPFAEKLSELIEELFREKEKANIWAWDVEKEQNTINSLLGRSFGRDLFLKINERAYHLVF